MQTFHRINNEMTKYSRREKRQITTTRHSRLRMEGEEIFFIRASDKLSAAQDCKYTNSDCQKKQKIIWKCLQKVKLWVSARRENLSAAKKNERKWKLCNEHNNNDLRSIKSPKIIN